MKERHRLWYKEAAHSRQEALPLGNGRLGGMIFGGMYNNRIQINEDTLFSGTRDLPPQPSLEPNLPEIRRLISRGEYRKAQDIIESRFDNNWGASYLPLGELCIQLEYGDNEEYEKDSYSRELDLREGVHRESYRIGGRQYRQECFCSFPDQILVWHFREESGFPVGLHCSLNSPLPHSTAGHKPCAIVLAGEAPSHVTPPSEQDDNPVRYEAGKGMKFCQVLKVINQGGTLENFGNEIVVRGAESITLIMGAATGYRGFGTPLNKYPSATILEKLSEIEDDAYNSIRERHVVDFTSLYAKVGFHLSGTEDRKIPTDQRIDNIKQGKKDNTLTALFFNYSRYLLISSSRPGSQPANLQGIWNESARPPWTGNLTTNINVQMNYWLAEPCDLSECHLPLLNAIEEATRTGSDTASKLYGCRGWCVHHGLDIWRRSDPSGGNAAWSFWPMAAPWLCQHLWDHFDFTGDKEYLDRVYPLIKGAVLFCLDWMIEDEEGFLITSPSTSPENSFITESGETAAVSKASTMDMSLIWQLFTHCIEASEILGRDKSFREELERSRSRLYPLKTGHAGQLQEWYQDFAEADPGHRHTAHLYALHPGNRIDPDKNPELAAACLKTLDLRIEHEGTDTVGWCFAWYMSFFARLGKGNRAAHYLNKVLANPFPNLLNAHRHPRISFYPMTIEANFGAAEGIIEMLMQSHRGFIDILPALPPDWPEGEITGLKARKGFRVDIRWNDHLLREGKIVSERGESCSIKSAVPLSVYSKGRETRTWKNEAGLLSFTTEKGGIYQIRRRK